MDESAFDAREFLCVAKGLISSADNEAALRTAVGRAYYASFLYALHVTGTRRQRDFHERVIKDLGGFDHPQLASQLGSMRRLREVTDYQPTPQLPQDTDWVRNWRHVEEVAERVVGSLEAVLHDDGTG